MRAVWLLGAAVLLLFAALAAYLAPLQPGILQLQLAFTPRAFGTVIHLWSAEDLARYRAHFPWDFLLLAGYAAFGRLFVRRAPLFAGRAPAARAVMAWLLPAAALCDATENAFHLWLTAAPRFGMAPIYALSALGAAAKWALLFAFAIAVLHALAKRSD
ncbi:MAG: hypothetical protein ROZ00_09195 [Denitratisoma sp.]|nr:hypothetical protein [Denitratisoma sp.]